MEIKLGDYIEDFGAVLQCPSCKGEYLHHYRIEIFNGAEGNGRHITVAPHYGTMNDDMAGNPSKRGSGLIIVFWCEGCRAKLKMHLAQHKGQTFIDLVDTGERMIDADLEEL